MKVGIISINMYSKKLNFACPLHTFAFQKFLQQHGIDNVVINYKPVYYDNFNLKHPSDYYFEKYNSLLNRNVFSEEQMLNLESRLSYFRKKYSAYHKIYSERETRYNKFQSFIDNNYVKTDICYDSELLEVLDPDCDCYMCVTDVIWKKDEGAGYDRGFFLGSRIMENKLKISYAASCGVKLPDNSKDKNLFFHYINDIDYISVREPKVKDFIETHSSHHAKVVLDPVLLHKKDFYMQYSIKPEEENYILLYYVMEKATDTIQQAVNYAKLHNLKIIELADAPQKNGRLEKFTDIEYIYKYDIGPEEWLGYIQHANVVFTNSFHGCCFSIVFEKEFYAGFRHGDKVTTLLKSLHLLDRQINAETDFSNAYFESIDYSTVNELLDMKRQDATDFIFNALQNIDNHAKNKDYTSYKKELKYRLLYNSRITSDKLIHNYTDVEGIVTKLSSGSLELVPVEKTIKNNESYRFIRNGFLCPGYEFSGWNIRVKIKNKWFWMLEDHSFVEKNNYDSCIHPNLKLFKDDVPLPFLPFNQITTVVAEAVWKKADITAINKSPLEKTIIRTLKKYVNKHLKCN